MINEDERRSVNGTGTRARGGAARGRAWWGAGAALLSLLTVAATSGCEATGAGDGDLAEKVAALMTCPPGQSRQCEPGLGGKLVCGCEPDDPPPPPPPPPPPNPHAVSQVVAGRTRTCVLLQDHSIRCWTVGDPIPATAAVSGAIAVWGGPDTNAYCYDLSDGSFACVDPDALQGIPGNLEISTQRDPALVNVQSVAMSDFTACATLRGGSIRCWGIAGPRLGAGVGTSVQVPFSSPWDLAVADVSASPGSDLCFASTTSVTCWGTGRYTSTAGTVIPLSNPDRLAAGNTLFCGSNSTTTTCWGITNSGDPRLQIPADVRGISRLGVGARHACAVRAGTVECWGDNSVCQAGAPGAGPAFYSSTAGGFQSLSVGANHTCALTAAGDLYCWGSSFGCDPTVKVAIP